MTLPRQTRHESFELKKSIAYNIIMSSKGFRKLLWPLNEKENAEILMKIERFKANLSFSLDITQGYISLVKKLVERQKLIKDNVSVVKEKVVQLHRRELCITFWSLPLTI
jgi:hypothetical protein